MLGSFLPFHLYVYYLHIITLYIAVKNYVFWAESNIQMAWIMNDIWV